MSTRATGLESPVTAYNHDQEAIHGGNIGGLESLYVPLVRDLADACASAQALAALPSVPKSLDLLDLSDKVSNLLLDLRFLQNKRNPAGRLPNEILSVIFKLVQDDLLAVSNHGSLYEDFKWYARWTRVLRICRHWRGVGFSTPLLWTTIFATDQTLPTVQLYDATSHLAQSSQCPLTVFVSLNAEPKVILKLLLQLPRIRELTVETYWMDPMTLPLAWCIPGPRLKVLHLMAPYHTSSQDLQKLFSGDLSYVSSLTLSRMTRFTTYNLAALRHLHIHQCCLSWIAAHESLLAFLASVPALEDLKFTHLDLEDYEDIFIARGTPFVDLPHLKRLAFVDLGRNVATLLSRLHLPVGVSLTFPWKRPCLPSEEAEVFPTDLSKLKNLEDLRYFELRFSEASDVLTVRAVGDSPASSAFFARWTLGEEEDPIALSDDFPRIFEQPEQLWLHLCDVESAVLRSLRHGFFQWLICRAENLKVLSLTGGAQLGVQDVVALLEPLDGQPQDTGNLACPKLEEIHLSLRAGDDYATLANILQTRRDLGCQVQRIRLYSGLESVDDHGRASVDDARNPWCLQKFVPEIVFCTGDVPEMEWADICSSQSEGPWEWPVWTKDGGCSYEQHSDMYYR